MSDSVALTPFPSCVPELTHELSQGQGSVLLRAMREADLPAVVEQSRDADTLAFTTVPRPYDLGAARTFLTYQSQQWGKPLGERIWVIEVTGEHSLPMAGTISVRPSEGRWELGFAMHPQARGRGAMSAATRAAARWAFEQGAPSLYWTAFVGNVASLRVAWACGFSSPVTLPAYSAHPEGVRDVWVASLLPGQPMRPSAPLPL